MVNALAFPVTVKVPSVPTAVMLGCAAVLSVPTITLPLTVPAVTDPATVRFCRVPTAVMLD